MSDHDNPQTTGDAAAEEARGRSQRVRRGRRGGRLDATAVVAVVLVLIAAGALLLTRPDDWSEQTMSPRDATLRSATLVCPSALAGKDAVGVASASDGSGSGSGSARTVTIAGDGAGAGSVRTVPGGVAPVAARTGGVVLTGSGPEAAGLVAGRSSRLPLAAADCPQPVGDEWFTGLSAGPDNNSSIELTNPNKGSGVVDITVVDAHGVVDEPKLRGVAVPGGASRTIDLQDLMPQGGSLAIHASVVRGQVAVDVRDRSGQVSGGTPSEEWLGGQELPARQNLLVGYPAQAQSRTLAIANPGESQVTATVKLVTPDAVLTPSGAPQVSIPPESVATVRLQDLLAQPVAKDAYGVEVDASGSVTATLRSITGGDLAETVPAGSVSGPSALVLPTGSGVRSKTVALAGASGVGAATIVSRDASGKELDSQRVALKQQQGATVDVPAGAAVVELRPERVSVKAAVVLAGRGRAGAAVVPFRELALSAQLPAVAPGLG